MELRSGKTVMPPKCKECTKFFGQIKWGSLCSQCYISWCQKHDQPIPQQFLHQVSLADEYSMKDKELTEKLKEKYQIPHSYFNFLKKFVENPRATAKIFHTKLFMDFHPDFKKGDTFDPLYLLSAKEATELSSKVIPSPFGLSHYWKHAIFSFTYDWWNIPSSEGLAFCYHANYGTPPSSVESAFQRTTQNLMFAMGQVSNKF